MEDQREKNNILTEFKQVEWNERVQLLVEKLDPLIGAYALMELVKSGTCFVHEVFVNHQSIGFYIGRVDVLANSERDLVIMHAMSDRKGHKPLIHVLSIIFPAVADQLRCNRVRIHSDQRKIDSLLESAGYEYFETVFMKEV